MFSKKVRPPQLKKLFRVTFGEDSSLANLTDEEKVMRNFGYVSIVAETCSDAKEKVNVKMPIINVEFMGLLLEK
jgi:hypothetical protein